jgi:hypothetical protein
MSELTMIQGAKKGAPQLKPPKVHGQRALYHWIAEAISDPDKDGPIHQLTLVHLVNDSQEEIHTIRRGDNTWIAEELADRIQSKAEWTAQNMLGTQEFKLYACYGTVAEPQAFYYFKIQKGYSTGQVTADSPDSKGLLQQQMRTFSEMAQMMMQQQQFLFKAQQDLMGPLLAENRELRRESRESFEVLKDLMIAHHDQRHEHRKKELQMVRETEERRKWISFVPLLANTLLGREVFPQSAADTAILDAAADALTEDEILMLGSKIPPELMGPLAARNEKYLAEKRRREEATAQALSYETPLAAAKDELELEGEVLDSESQEEQKS